MHLVDIHHEIITVYFIQICIRSIIAHKEFVEKHVDGPKYKDRYAAFVKGNLEFIGDDKQELIDKVYEKIGQVDMYMHKITRKQRILDVPSFRMEYI